MSWGLLLDLFWLFARLSLVSIGGMNSVLPEIYREVVDVRGWTSGSDLADLLALAQASPGPNGLVSALIGWRVAGLPGFVVCAAAANVPPAIVAFGTSRLRRRLLGARWLQVVQVGLIPIVVGLTLASGIVIAQLAGDSTSKVAIAVVVALVTWRTGWNPLWLLGAGALVGLGGL